MPYNSTLSCLEKDVRLLHWGAKVHVSVLARYPGVSVACDGDQVTLTAGPSRTQHPCTPTFQIGGAFSADMVLDLQDNLR